jgi:type IV pilus assembly protein PilV
MTPRPFVSMPRRSVRARGFSLIEVLVSIFIVSLGILALGGLLQSAARYGKMSEVRSTAALLANDMADRIRANAGSTSTTPTDYNYGGDAFPTTLPTAQSDCLKSSQCSAPQLAKRDKYVWTMRLANMLPQGSAYILYNAPGGGSKSKGSYDIWVAWSDPATSSGPTERSASECPTAWTAATADTKVRCIYLQVGL